MYALTSPLGESDACYWKFFPEKDKGPCQCSYPRDPYEGPLKDLMSRLLCWMAHNMGYSVNSRVGSASSSLGV